ncbi:uncharacterized membrane protein YtjA (UPF0391 family) [Paraburkholderia sp. GAS199]
MNGRAFIRLRISGAPAFLRDPTVGGQEGFFERLDRPDSMLKDPQRHEQESQAHLLLNSARRQKTRRARGATASLSRFQIQSSNPSVGGPMLRYAAIFFIIAIIAAVFGFGGIAAGATEIAKVLFFIFVVIFLVTLLMGVMRR